MSSIISVILLVHEFRNCCIDLVPAVFTGLLVGLAAVGIYHSDLAVTEASCPADGRLPCLLTSLPVTDEVPAQKGSRRPTSPARSRRHPEDPRDEKSSPSQKDINICLLK